MVGSHKILTVSYGTFSCTLEGFDDSFETMKAIAEYFRDLAADDRYFGAEPPQPDAEMLARIAEREVARRVEARMESSGIVLRVGQSLDKAEAAPQVQAEPAPAMPPASAVQAPVMPATVMPAPVAAPVGQAVPAPDTVAAKLQRIRAVVGKGAVAPVEDAETDGPARAEPSAALAALVAEASRAAPEPLAAIEHGPVFEDLAVGDVAAGMAEDDADMVADVMAAFVEEEVESSLADEIAEIGADLTVDETAPEVTAAEPAIVEDDDVVADVMAAFAEEEAESRLAAEIAVADAGMADAAPVVEEMAEAEAPVPAQPIRARVIRMRKADFDRVLAEGALVSAEEAEAAEDIPGADVAADMAEAADRDDGFDDLGDLAELADLTDGDDLADLMRLDGPVATLSEDDEAELLAELAAVENDVIEPVPAATGVEVEDELGAELAAIAAEMDIPEVAPVVDVAEVETVRADEDEAIANVLRAMQDAPEAVETVEEVAAPAAFADEATDDLEAGVEAEEVEDLVDLFAEDEPAPVMPVAEEPARPRFVAPEADEAALTRLLSETDAQMSGPDAARRREAIAQLRAAVAATEAARALGESQGSDDEETEDDFRADLRHAVRPRRPVVGQTDLRGERPRPAPLKLVASQRIDLPEPAAPAVSMAPAMDQPIRPRRVTVEQIAAAREAEDARTMASNPAAAAASADSFADFAERMGATSLADLLEAAAAYTAFVEGTGDFSRPQILRRVTQVSPETNKEDGLRLFGTLLREGRIRRSDRAGRFEVAEDTRFNPDRRAV
jgi:hypothetical protein